MPERDYPIGHPAASDYKGEPYRPPFDASAEDFPPGHPARAGKNRSALDTPDGMRAAHNARVADLHELAAVGSLPPLRDPGTGDPIQVDAHTMAYIYRVRQALRGPVAAEITARYGLVPQDQVCVCGLPKQAHDKKFVDHEFRPWADDAPAVEITAKDQALGHIRSLGYTPEAAEAIFEKYGLPDLLKDREAALSR